MSIWIECTHITHKSKCMHESNRIRLLLSIDVFTFTILCLTFESSFYFFIANAFFIQSEMRSEKRKENTFFMLTSYNHSNGIHTLNIFISLSISLVNFEFLKGYHSLAFSANNMAKRYPVEKYVFFYFFKSNLTKCVSAILPASLQYAFVSFKCWELYLKK